MRALGEVAAPLPRLAKAPKTFMLPPDIYHYDPRPIHKGLPEIGRQGRIKLGATRVAKCILILNGSNTPVSDKTLPLFETALSVPYVIPLRSKLSHFQFNLITKYLNDVREPRPEDTCLSYDASS